jgi:serine/threonine protein kinase
MNTTIDEWDGKPLWLFEQGDLVIDDIRALGRLGVGFRCESWIAHSPRFGIVTLKLCRPHEIGSERGIRAMKREADALLLVQHRAVRSLIEPRLTADIPTLVFEHAPGTSLSEVLDHRTVAPSHALDLVATLMAAVAATHRVGLVHLDLKPSNVIINGSRFDRPTLIDFGSARPIGFDPGPGTPPGSPGYAPPELERNERVTPAIDVFGLGTILFEAITGEAAFDPDLDAADRAPVERPSELADWCPTGIDDLVLQMLEPNPADRPTLSELGTTVDRLRHGMDLAEGGWTARSLQHLWGER